MILSLCCASFLVIRYGDKAGKHLDFVAKSLYNMISDRICCLGQIRLQKIAKIPRKKAQQNRTDADNVKWP